MKTAIHTTQRAIAGAAAGLAIALSSPAAFAQWTVFDPANLTEAIVQEINQLDQLAMQNTDAIQQLTNYKLQLQNLQQLPGSVRGDVKDRLQKQLLGNVKDFGRSLLNKNATNNPNSASYYVQAEDIINVGIGDVPRTTASTDTELSSLGMTTGRDSSFGRDNSRDRMQYDRVMDDMRQVALTRQNADDRAVQANQVTGEMAKLSDNNTVGAIQLLSAQNTLAYAQNEDLLKTQSAMLKNQQEAQMRLLVEKEEYRKRELARLAKIKASVPVTDVRMVQ